MDIGITKTFRTSAREYVAKYEPTRIGINEIGTWYEHPIYGDEAGLLVVPTGSQAISSTCWMEIPYVCPIYGELS